MKLYVVKQHVDGRTRLVECDTFGVVTVHRTKTGAQQVVQSLGENNGYFVARDRIQRDQTVVNVVD